MAAWPSYTRSVLPGPRRGVAPTPLARGMSEEALPIVLAAPGALVYLLPSGVSTVRQSCSQSGSPKVLP
jgi:hypothetical protein